MQLTQFAIHELQASKVDVNEQNGQAVGFYQRMGFVVTGRHETDGLGKPYPLLLMELRS
jgi:putative acetyltransferase